MRRRARVGWAAGAGGVSGGKSAGGRSLFPQRFAGRLTARGGSAGSAAERLPPAPAGDAAPASQLTGTRALKRCLRTLSSAPPRPACSLSAVMSAWPSGGCARGGTRAEPAAQTPQLSLTHSLLLPAFLAKAQLAPGQRVTWQHSQFPSTTGSYTGWHRCGCWIEHTLESDSTLAALLRFSFLLVDCQI